ncbi:hypothetical protein [Parafilimonas sp.]|uniref:hypothetical protein n=1 Tax=Parafilimonas sp. TaxID=1969739 RepID=UPI003F8176AD
MLLRKKKVTIPSKGQILKVLEEFDSIDLENKLKAKSLQEYVQELDDFFVSKLGFIFFSVRTSNTNKVPSKVYRLRKQEGFINTSLITEFSHPQVSKTLLQRANLPNCPTFYGSPSAHTALLETLELSFKKEGNNFYYLSEWSFREDQPIYISPFIYGEYDVVDEYNSMSKKAFKDLEEEFSVRTEEQSKCLEEMLHFYATIFEKKEDHLLSSYLAHKHFYTPSNIRTDMLIYPSIQTNKSSLNFAIHPNAVMHKMFLNRVFLFKIDDYKSDINSGELEVAFDMSDLVGLNNHHGYLIWTNLSYQDMEDFKKLFPEIKAQ